MFLKISRYVLMWWHGKKIQIKTGIQEEQQQLNNSSSISRTTTTMSADRFCYISSVFKLLILKKNIEFMEDSSKVNKNNELG